MWNYMNDYWLEKMRLDFPLKIGIKFDLKRLIKESKEERQNKTAASTGFPFTTLRIEVDAFSENMDRCYTKKMQMCAIIDSEPLSSPIGNNV